MFIWLSDSWLNEDRGVSAGQSILSKGRQVLLGVQLIIACLSLLFISPAAADTEPRPSSASIRTPDFDESVRWYQDKLGFRLLGSDSLVQGRKAVMERSGFLLEIAEADHILSQEPESTASVQVTSVPVISLLVPDVDREVRRLDEADVDILQPPQDDLDGTYRTAQIRDNGRHRIELREPLDDPSRLHFSGR
jgi:catechol 2,3-dioxygenase-like lactoylglutathione lyase family enzyme